MIILPFFTSVLPLFAATATTDSSVRSDSTTNLARTSDTAAITRQPSPLVGPSPLYSTDLVLGGGVVAIDFPERTRFSSELGSEASGHKWTVDQPFTGSDLGPRIELGIALRRKGLFRLVAGGWWEGWSAQAIARDTTGTLHHRSYSSDVLVASLGGDLLISPSILRLDGGQEASFGARWLIGAGRLEGRQTAWGIANGVSVLAAAEFFQWNNGAISAHLGVDWLSLQSDRAWSELLWSTDAPDKVSWSGGGLNLGVQLRWGAVRDRIAKARADSAQKK